MRCPGKILVAAVATLILAACGGGGGSPDSGATSNPTPSPPPSPPQNQPPAPVQLSVSGVAQKGPFLVDSQLLVHALDSRGQRSGQVVSTRTSDALGTFIFDVDGAGLYELEIIGFVRSELDGSISTNTVTLRAIFLASDAQQQSANINALTHLAADRVLALLSSGGVTGTAALAQAQSELLSYLSDVAACPTDTRIGDLTLYGNPDNPANACLLALSALFTQHGAIRAAANGSMPTTELAAMFFRIITDWQDGQLDDPVIVADLRAGMSSIDPAAVDARLHEIAVQAGRDSMSAADLTMFIDTDLDGTTNYYDDDDDNDGIPDTEDDDPLIPAEDGDGSTGSSPGTGGTDVPGTLTATNARTILSANQRLTSIQFFMTNSYSSALSSDFLADTDPSYGASSPYSYALKSIPFERIHTCQSGGIEVSEDTLLNQRTGRKQVNFQLCGLPGGYQYDGGVTYEATEIYLNQWPGSYRYTFTDFLLISNENNINITINGYIDVYMEAGTQVSDLNVHVIDHTGGTEFWTDDFHTRYAINTQFYYASAIVTNAEIDHGDHGVFNSDTVDDELTLAGQAGGVMMENKARKTQDGAHFFLDEDDDGTPDALAVIDFKNQFEDRMPGNNSPTFTYALGQKEVDEVIAIEPEFYDADFDFLFFDWELISSPDGATATIEQPDPDQLSFSGNRNGAYVVRLTVSDAFGGTSSDDIAIQLEYPVPQVYVNIPYLLDVDTELVVDISPSNPAGTITYELNYGPPGMYVTADGQLIWPADKSGLPLDRGFVFFRATVSNESYSTEIEDRLSLTTANTEWFTQTSVPGLSELSLNRPLRAGGAVHPYYVDIENLGQVTPGSHEREYKFGANYLLERSINDGFLSWRDLVSHTFYLVNSYEVITFSQTIDFDGDGNDEIGLFASDHYDVPYSRDEHRLHIHDPYGVHIWSSTDTYRWIDQRDLLEMMEFAAADINADDVPEILIAGAANDDTEVSISAIDTATGNTLWNESMPGFRTMEVISDGAQTVLVVLVQDQLRSYIVDGSGLTLYGSVDWSCSFVWPRDLFTADVDNDGSQEILLDNCNHLRVMSPALEVITDFTYETSTTGGSVSSPILGHFSAGNYLLRTAGDFLQMIDLEGGQTVWSVRVADDTIYRMYRYDEDGEERLIFQTRDTVYH